MSDRVLLVAPHPDDESIGCGGAACLHRRRGEPVHVVFLTSGEQGIPGLAPEAVWAVREAEAREAAAVLGATGLSFLRLPDQGLDGCVERGAAELARVFEAERPSLVYLPHPGEDHPDHEATLPLVRAARARLAGWPERPELRGYEVWSPMSRYGWVEDVSAVMGQKLRAVRCYRSQLAQFRYDRAVRGLNQYRGVLGAGGRYGEAFVYLEPG